MAQARFASDANFAEAIHHAEFRMPPREPLPKFWPPEWRLLRQTTHQSQNNRLQGRGFVYWFFEWGRGENIGESSALVPAGLWPILYIKYPKCRRAEDIPCAAATRILPVSQG